MSLSPRKVALPLFLVAAISLPCAGQPTGRRAQRSAPSELLTAQRQWWEAISGADTSVLARWSSARLSATLSSGRVFDRAALLGFAGGISHPVSTRWSAEAVAVASPTLVVTQAEVVEGDGPRPSHYRYLTVFSRERDGWRVVSAQSTRMPAFTPRIAVPGGLDAYAGSYRTPRGLALRVTASDSVLTMVEPSGREMRYWPIGVGLFESDYVSPDGAITRLAFARDSAGRVAALNVLSPGVVNTFPRMD